MVSELRLRNQSQQLYVRALSTAWRSSIEVHDPSLWLLREPELEEKMLRDADIAHAVQYRRHMIAGQRWAILPRVEGSPRAAVAVGVATELLEGIKNFTQARLNLSRAFFSGARFGFIHGCMRKMKIGDGVERLWWCPTTIEDRDKRTYRIVPENDGETLSAHWELWNIPKAQFEPESVEDSTQTIRHVYQEDQASLGHGRALREALGWWWYAKTHVFEESLQAVERFAQGILTAKVDGARDAESGLPNTELINEWRAVLEDLRARNVLVYDSADEIEHINMNASGWELLSSIREELRSTIFTLILGANLTTAANKGGSYALAAIQENSTEALVQYDRETLEETLTDDLLGCVWFKNYANLVELGVAEEKPRFNITQEKKEDPKERADVASVLNQMGVELSLEDVLEQTGFRKPEPGEALVEKPEPAPDPFGGDGGLGQINPLGGQPGMFQRADFEVKHAPGGSSEGGQFLPADDAGGGGSKDKPKKKGKPKKDKPKADKPKADKPKAGKPKKDKPEPPEQVAPPRSGEIQPYGEQRSEDHEHRRQRIQQELAAGRITPEVAQDLDAALQKKHADANSRETPARVPNPGADESIDRHMVDGSWTPERQAMHDEIIANTLRGVPVSENRTLHMMGGGPAAGKSSLIRGGFMSLPPAHVMSNADEFKEELPEYREAVTNREKAAAWNAHEESSMLGKRAMRESREAGLDVAWDGTGDHSLEKLTSQVRPFRDAGYHVKADYVTVDPAEAWSRAEKRSAKKGRYVPETVVKETHRNVSRVWPEAVAAGLFDESNLYDTNAKTPTLIASAKGTEVVVHDQEAYDRFVSQGMSEGDRRRAEAASEKEKAIRGGRSPLSYPGGTLPKGVMDTDKPFRPNPPKEPGDIDYEDYYLRDDT